MNQPHQLQVSQQRVHEILKGKASTAISDLMLENAQLTAVVEQLNKELQDVRSQLSAMRLSQRTRAEGNEASPDPAPGLPQDT